MVKFKMLAPSSVSRNFLWRDKKTEVLKYKSHLVISMDVKKRIERKISLI